MHSRKPVDCYRAEAEEVWPLAVFYRSSMTVEACGWHRIVSCESDRVKACLGLTQLTRSSGRHARVETTDECELLLRRGFRFRLHSLRLTHPKINDCDVYLTR